MSRCPINSRFIQTCKYPTEFSKLAVCQENFENCDATLQQNLFINFFAMMVSYLHGSTITTPYLALDNSPEANNLGYKDGEDGTIGNQPTV